MGISATFWECYGKAGVLSVVELDGAGWQGEIGLMDAKTLIKNEQPTKKGYTIFSNIHRWPK